MLALFLPSIPCRILRMRFSCYHADPVHCTVSAHPNESLQWAFSQRTYFHNIAALRQLARQITELLHFTLTNTTLLLRFTHELQANEEMARATGRDFPARQRFTPEGVSERQTVFPPMHGTAELGKGLEAAVKRQLGLMK